MSVDDAELRAEQAWLDDAHRHLDAMRLRAGEVLDAAERAVRDENTIDARVASFHLKRREESLEPEQGPLCFGRIDTEAGDRYYVGRRHVEDAANRPVVVDWRAPVSSAFYRATAVDPCGLEFRRRFSIEERRIVSLFDEDLTDPDGAVGGVPDPLLAELDRSRTGQMRDIVATIAAEQDEIIRAPLSELLVVQGGPGTGKTAVGLHRAAFLLFQHRRELIDREVLVIGPNPLFLRYIADVLPSLGETAVRQATVAGLLAARYRVRAVDEPDVARLKGDGRMAAVIDAAIRQRIAVPTEGLELRSGVAVVRFPSQEVEAMVKSILSRRLPVNQGRDVLRRMLVAEAWRRHSARPGVDPGGEPVFSSGARSDKAFRAAVDRMWPTGTGANLLRALLGSPRRLSRAADGILSADEQALLRRPSASKVGDEPWTEADIPLLDEVDARCGGVAAVYGHVVVDEAQDLSPMALRLIGRRADGGSMTILGDLAQATSPEATGSWDRVVETLAAVVPMGRGAGREPVAVGPGADASAGVGPTVRRTELTVGYRVPAAILDVANRLLSEAAPEVTPARSVRVGGDPPLTVEVDEERLMDAVAAEIEALRERTSSVAVVGLEPALDRCATTLGERGVATARVGAQVSAAGLPGAGAVALVTPQAVKGLEFDAVVVVEPADIADLDAGLRHLYVAMTRPVQHLGLVHSRALPALLELDGAGDLTSA